MLRSYDTVEVEIIPKKCQFTVGPIQQPVNKNNQIQGSITIMGKTVFENQDIILTKSNALVKDFLKILTKLEKPCFAALEFNESQMDTDSECISIIEAEYQYLRVSPLRKKYKFNYPI